MASTIQQSGDSGQDKRNSTLGVVLALACQLYSSRLRRRRFAILRLILLFILLWSWFLYLVLAYIIPLTPALVPVSLLFATRPLLVVAHPDDESLFFGPTIVSLTRAEHRSMSILVLSSGTP